MYIYYNSRSQYKTNLGGKRPFRLTLIHHHNLRAEGVTFAKNSVHKIYTRIKTFVNLTTLPKIHTKNVTNPHLYITASMAAYAAQPCALDAHTLCTLSDAQYVHCNCMSQTVGLSTSPT